MKTIFGFPTSNKLIYSPKHLIITHHCKRGRFHIRIIRMPFSEDPMLKLHSIPYHMSPIIHLTWKNGMVHLIDIGSISI